MATRFYLINVSPTFSPAVNRGPWNTVNSPATIPLSTGKYGNAITTLVMPEGSRVGFNLVLMARVVSPRLFAQTLSGTFNLVIAVAAANAPTIAYSWVIHAYVTQGDTDLLRATLISGYNEGVPGNWPPFLQGKALLTSPTVPSTPVQDGDRIVLELGYSENAASNSANFGMMNYGALPNTTDLTIGDTQVTTHPGYIEFSQNLLVELPPEIKEPSVISQIITQVVKPAPGVPSVLSQVISQTAKLAPPADTRLSHVISQAARLPPPAASSLSHVIVQVVPTPAGALPDLSGLYFINHNKPIFHDSYYHATELKIPDPTIRTALLGE